MEWRRPALVLLCLAALVRSTPQAAGQKGHFLYVAVPGIRNYVEYGGVGILVYDIDKGHKLVKRIPTWDVPQGTLPENVKGIAASAKTRRLYVTTTKRLACFDLISEKKVWEKTYDGGCDRLAISPDGRVLYVPSLEGPHWHVVDGLTGDVMARVEPQSGAHNTVYGPDGSRVYLAGLSCSRRRIQRPTRLWVGSVRSPIRFVLLRSMGARRSASST